MWESVLSALAASRAVQRTNEDVNPPSRLPLPREQKSAAMPRSPTNPPSDGRCLLFEVLPPELRLRIYECLWEDKRRDLFYSKVNRSRVFMKRTKAGKVKGRQTALLVTCRKINNEALPALYGTVQFVYQWTNSQLRRSMTPHKQLGEFIRQSSVALDLGNARRNALLIDEVCALLQKQGNSSHTPGVHVVRLFGLHDENVPEEHEVEMVKQPVDLSDGSMDAKIWAAVFEEIGRYELK
ncbi:uncharacterized protein LTR77_007067 [Saxophila tyrrhenica]|uniref:Uncharacterized protein n=1 Tax=Saxophila tyrrhenica TaxID=1690608 RepID=A0AAV9P433_9PEZI|nr:hypothetical protein LTR77_007067 [Saxophila tyrrhenica]